MILKFALVSKCTFKQHVVSNVTFGSVFCLLNMYAGQCRSRGDVNKHYGCYNLKFFEYITISKYHFADRKLQKEGFS